MAGLEDPFAQAEAAASTVALAGPGGNGNRGGRSSVDIRQFIQRDLGIRDLADVRLLTRLISSGALSMDDAETFVLDAQRRHRSLMEHALETSIVGESDILTIAAELYDLAAVVIDEIEIDDGIASLLQPEQARQLKALPYARSSEGELLVALGDATNEDAVRARLKEILPRERISFRLASKSALEVRIESLYRMRPVVAATEYADATPEPARLRARDFGDNPVVRLFSDLLTQAVQDGASDMHFESAPSQTLVRFRVDGMLHDAMQVPAQLATPLIAYIKTSADMLPHEKRTPQDGRFSQLVGNDRIDLRVVTTPVHGGQDLEQAVLRLQDPNRSLLSLTQLGMTEADFKRYLTGIEKPYGFCLVSGPTGSGKTTTLYASLQMSVKPELKVISVEDPVELSLAGVNQIEIPRAGDDRWGFKEILPSIVRSDPNIVMVGEIRDPETASLALNASLTGHFVYSTLHANNSLSTVIRLAELGVEPFLIAEALEIVVAQRLIRRVCSCSDMHPVSAAELRAAGIPEDAVLQVEEQGGSIDLKKANPKGCTKCRGRGYRGRTGVFEILLVTQELREAILRRADMHELYTIAREAGLKSLREDGWIKVKGGLTTVEELNREIK